MYTSSEDTTVILFSFKTAAKLSNSSVCNKRIALSVLLCVLAVEQIDKFLQKHGEFVPVNLKELWERLLQIPYPYHLEKYLKMSPLSTGTDGFFIAVMEKKNG